MSCQKYKYSVIAYLIYWNPKTFVFSVCYIYYILFCNLSVLVNCKFSMSIWQPSTPNCKILYSNWYNELKLIFVSFYSRIWINRFYVTYLLTDKVAWPTWYNLNVYIVTFDLLLPINRTITWSSPSKPTENGIWIIVFSFGSFKAFCGLKSNHF